MINSIVIMPGFFGWSQQQKQKSALPNRPSPVRLFKFITENNADKLVIDLRWNNGGNTGLLPYFINAAIKNDKINKSGIYLQ